MDEGFIVGLRYLPRVKQTFPHYRGCNKILYSTYLGARIIPAANYVSCNSHSPLHQYMHSHHAG